MPDVQSVDQVFQEMETRFRSEKAGDMNARFQFNITGDDGGMWWADIQNGECKIQKGETDDATVTISAASNDWIDIVSGKLNPQMAFMTGKVKVQGDIGLATKLGTLFF